MSKLALRNLNQVDHTSNPSRNSGIFSWVTHRGSGYRTGACQAIADLAYLEQKDMAETCRSRPLLLLILTFLIAVICCVQYLPPQMRLTPTVIQSVGIWGGTAALGAIWLVQVNLPHAQGHL